MTPQIFRDDLLAGSVAIVSGAGSGLGRATALQLASLSAHVVVCGRRREPLDETAALGPRGLISTVTCDIREEAEVEKLVDTVLDRHGKVDLLVNNAGGQFLAPAETVSPKGFRTVIRLNLEGTWLMTSIVAAKAMIPAGRGKIVSITISPHHGQPGIAHSAAARAGVENLTRSLSIEWARYGITLNAIAAGQFETEVLRTKYPPEIAATMASSIPLGHLGRQEDIAWMVAYLASTAGDFISGSVLTIDGARDNWYGRWPDRGALGADAEGQPLTEQRRP